MKPGIHPMGYRPVVFHDVAIDKRWMMMSTVQTDQTTVWEDGRTYPIYKVETSMYSHPLHGDAAHHRHRRAGRKIQ
jgi:large subunit ribosomal protein L31